MITNRVGYSPSVRQSAPQRQNVAFGRDWGFEDRTWDASSRLSELGDDEWEKKSDEFLKELSQPSAPTEVPKPKQKSMVSKIASGIWSGYKEFAKADVSGLGHVTLATIAMLAYFGIQSGREHLAEHKVETAISDTKARTKVLANSALLENHHDCSSERREYLNQVVDSVRGGSSTPNKTFNIKYKRLEHDYEQKMQAKADSINRIADSVYHSAGLESPRMSKGYVPYVPKIKK